MYEFDYLIVGAGLFGSVCAHEASKRGKKCLVIDKKDHAGGNVYCEFIENINVHKYGPHIFHTDDKKIWDYVNRFCEFNSFVNAPIANYNGEIYNLPFNMNTFNKLWGVITPEQAKKKIEEQKEQSGIKSPENLEEQALFLVGKDIYERLIKGYTKKQWGRDPKELPAFIIKRLPVRFTYDNNYFNDKYQGIPKGGYNIIINKMLENSEVKLKTDYFATPGFYKDIAEKTIFSGRIDQFYNYRFGKLEYRSLRFESMVLDKENYQGNAVVNYTDEETPYTRIIEHKYFDFTDQKKTVITKEYPVKDLHADEPSYPINDEKNNRIYLKYKRLAQNERNVIFGGRLGEYKYYDMDDVIKQALELMEKEALA